MAYEKRNEKVERRKVRGFLLCTELGIFGGMYYCVANEIEVTFDTASYSTDDLAGYEGKSEYEVEAKIVCESPALKTCKPVFLIIGASSGNE